jgi:DNA-binding Lrp family transcriptional regulator
MIQSRKAGTKIMDELDVKILRALISEREVAPSSPKVKSSLRALAARLEADDMTVAYRYKKLQESGCMSVWSLLLNPAFFGYRVMEVMVDVQPESAKADMIRKLKLVNEITGIVDFYGRGLRLFVIYNGEESRSRTIELISRITNAEKITQSRTPLPRSGTKRLTETDLAIIRSLSKDARKSAVIIAKELKLSAKTVRNRIDKLRKENTIFPFPILSVENVPGLIPVYLSYVYTSNDAKASVDRTVLLHFDSSYLTGSFPDPEIGGVMLGASSMAEVRKFTEWAKSQKGIAGARVDIATATFMFPEKLIELAELRSRELGLQKNALL